jgi:hypothetical protein
MMAIAKAYDEIVDFIADGHGPEAVSAFRPSAETRKRVADLVSREKLGELSKEESEELDHYVQIEHIMRLAKARARQRLMRQA